MTDAPLGTSLPETAQPFYIDLDGNRVEIEIVDRSQLVSADQIDELVGVTRPECPTNHCEILEGADEETEDTQWTREKIDAVIERRLSTRRIELANQKTLSRTAFSHSLDVYKLGMMDLRDALLLAQEGSE